MEKAQRLADLHRDMHNAHAAVCDPTTKLVYGEGDVDAALMIVGEAPGSREDMLGRPFVGPAGEFLRQALETAGIHEREVYMTNVIRCRLTTATRAGQRNRPPRSEEVRMWRVLLVGEIQIVAPRVVLCLGSTAASAVIHPRFVMTAERGKWFEGPFHTRTIATFHPAYARRAGPDGVHGNQFRADLTAVAAELRNLAP